MQPRLAGARGNGGGVVLQFRSNRRIVGVASNRIEICSRSGSQATRARHLSQGTVAQEGAAEGWEKQQNDYRSRTPSVGVVSNQLAANMYRIDGIEVATNSC